MLHNTLAYLLHDGTELVAVIVVIDVHFFIQPFGYNLVIRFRYHVIVIILCFLHIHLPGSLQKEPFQQVLRLKLPAE